MSHQLLRKFDTYRLGDQTGRPKCAERAGRCHSDATIVLERSWRSGEIPDDWGKAGVTPIYKKSGEDDLGDCEAETLYLVSEENCGASLLGCLFWAHEGEGDWE